MRIDLEPYAEHTGAAPNVHEIQGTIHITAGRFTFDLRETGRDDFPLQIRIIDSDRYSGRIALSPECANVVILGGVEQ